MNDELEQLLRSLHLRRILEILEKELADAEKKDLSYTELLLRLFRAQWHHRQETALAWRIRQARIPEQWTLESFPWKTQPGVSQRQIRELAELEFIRRAENIVFIGPCDAVPRALSRPRTARLSSPRCSLASALTVSAVAARCL